MILVTLTMAVGVRPAGLVQKKHHVSGSSVGESIIDDLPELTGTSL